MRATRRTFRTAAIATGAIAALAVPTTAAFASDAPVTPQGHVAAGDETGKDQTGKDQTGQDKTDKDQTGNDKGKDKDNETPKPGSWESKGTTNLGNGWSAKVDVNVSARSAKAAISQNGTTKGTLTAYAKSTTSTIGGNTFTLSPEGTITMKAKPTPPKPKPVDKRVFVRDAKLADGSLAKIYKIGPNHYQADIYAHGAKLDTLDANGRSASGQNNGLHVTLNPDGTIKSWVEGKTHHDGTKPTPKPVPKKDSHQVVPKGGVKAGAEGVTTGASDDAPLIAAGSGMAALGAAGLGFAVYRRKQNG
ncbi:hypothetical protein [Streptomyces kanamyceticus]|uniref:LPXTG cell wall anchor domain-containing protein n=1 Tax=Streptomyces kanamyceticus TaxID=1967 RepID=A0A5J6GIS7_STRKN|nr:hypothetical protein [Streptomyces kanamyceticus]QEU93026.1 hypothetical protein CP970_20815 [Streptomyces kanamyceticus]